MKVERSTRHAEYMHEIARRCNARRAELIAAGVEPDQASRQAQAEIVTPELRRRRARRREIEEARPVPGVTHSHGSACPCMGCQN